MSGELTPPPPGGYYDLVFEDSEPQDGQGGLADGLAKPAGWPTDPGVPASPGASVEARNLAPARKLASKRRLGAVALVAIASGVVLFGAVGALALKRTQREEERVSRALLPRAEWATSASAGAGPSADFAPPLDDEEQPAPPPERAAARARTHHRKPPHAPHIASRPVAARVVPERVEPGPAPQATPPPQGPALPPPAAGLPTSAPAEQGDETPQYARQGFRSPAQEIPNCVQSSVRIPRDLQGFTSGPITVRFAVDKDGSVTLFRVEGQVPDRRIAEAIGSAVRECRFIPGADDQGRPVRLWVVMPIRFVR